MKSYYKQDTNVITYFIVSTTLQKIIIIFIPSIYKRNTEINLELNKYLNWT